MILILGSLILDPLAISVVAIVIIPVFFLCDNRAFFSLPIFLSSWLILSVHDS